MARRTENDPAEVRSAVTAVRAWLLDENAPPPARTELAAAVRGTARALAAAAPGHSVEVRVPPFVAVQCVEGPRHTRGNPPNIVETDPRTWLLLATGLLDFSAAVAAGRVEASGARAPEIARRLPLVPVHPDRDRPETPG